MKRNEFRAVLLGFIGLAAAARADAGTVTFNYTTDNATQTWTVPAGVTQATFDVQGAAGGNRTGRSIVGGKGGHSVAVFATTPGEIIKLVVGKAGANTAGANTISAGGAPGGGDGYVVITPGPPSGGAGGGGASIVGRSTLDLATPLLNTWLIAGGGGGGAGDVGTSNGGDGGGLSGAAGGTPPCTSAGGNQTGTTGSGQALQGQDAGTSEGAGGGGGYYGGQVSNCGGGGGSGYVSSTALEAASFPAPTNTGNGVITISWDNPPLVVNSSADTDDGSCTVSNCTLREAIEAANAADGADSISFDLPVGTTITLGSLLPTVVTELAIDGSERRITLDAAGNSGILIVSNDGTLALTGLTLTRGNQANGGALNVTGAVVIDRCTFIANNATTQGGAIAIQGISLRISNSSFIANTSSFGAAIQSYSDLFIDNSTFSGNLAIEGVNKAGGALLVADVVEISNSSFIDNEATFRGAAILSTSGSDMRLRNVLFSGNKSTDIPGSCVDIAGNPTDDGGNLADDASCGFSAGSSRVATTAAIKVGPLADNGGPTRTHALLPGSAAIDAGVSCAAAPVDNLDQRGVTRPINGLGAGSANGEVDGACDVGAYEAGRYDFGDAPDDATTPRYPTLLVNDGALHQVLASAPHLGAVAPDAEGTVSAVAGAVGDDNNQASNDEDGIDDALTLIAGSTASIPVDISGSGRLSAWVDWNRSGSWADSGEQIANDRSVTAVGATLAPAVPIGASIGTSYLRLRICSASGQCNVAGGVAEDGEVEDHAVTIAKATVTLSAGASSVPEGNNLTITATSSTVLSEAITVTLATSGTATAGDYSLPASIVIAAGQLAASVTLATIEDAAVEANEMVIIDIDSVTNALESGTQQQTVTILNDDAGATPTPGPTASPTPTAVPSATPTPTPAATATPTALPTASPSPTAVPTVAPTPTPTPVVRTAVTTDPEGREVVLTLPEGGSIGGFARGTPPAGAAFADGYYELEIDGIAAGGTVTAVIDFAADIDIRDYLGCVGSACDEIPGVEIDGSTVTVTLTDGGVGDSDGLANGVIVFAGGPARRGGGGGSFGWLGMLPLFGLAALRRNRRSVSGNPG